MSDDDLMNRIDEALKDVTPGPWVVEYDSGNTCLLMGSDCQMCDMTHDAWTPENDADWHFIAAARELVPLMRDRIEADAKRIAELEAAGHKLLAEWSLANAVADKFKNLAAAQRHSAEARIAELEAALREIAGMDVVSASAVAFNALGEKKE